MATVKTNMVILEKKIEDRLGSLTNETILRPVMFGLIDLITNRIHIEGKDSNGQQIGIYSSGYMQVRTGNYANAERFKKGKKVGQIKNAGRFTDRTIRLNRNTGTFSGEEKVGTNRPNYNRSDDPKVVISLTRQLENDYGVEPTERGYGIGFKNKHNYDKSQWVQQLYRKRIFDLTESEIEYAHNYIRQLVVDQLNN